MQQNVFPVFLLKSNVLLLTAQKEKKNATTQTTQDKKKKKISAPKRCFLTIFRFCRKPTDSTKTVQGRTKQRSFVFWYQIMLLVKNTVKYHCPIFHSTVHCSYQSVEKCIKLQYCMLALPLHIRWTKHQLTDEVSESIHHLITGCRYLQDRSSSTSAWLSCWATVTKCAEARL